MSQRSESPFFIVCLGVRAPVRVLPLGDVERMRRTLRDFFMFGIHVSNGINVGLK